MVFIFSKSNLCEIHHKNLDGLLHNVKQAYIPSRVLRDSTVSIACDFLRHIYYKLYRIRLAVRIIKLFVLIPPCAVHCRRFRNVEKTRVNAPGNNHALLYTGKFRSTYRYNTRGGQQ